MPSMREQSCPARVNVERLNAVCFEWPATTIRRQNYSGARKHFKAYQVWTALKSLLHRNGTGGRIEVRQIADFNPVLLKHHIYSVRERYS